MECKYWWFKLPQDIIENFTQADGSKVELFEDFNLLVSDITWWKLPQKLQLMADFVGYDHKFTWFRLPEQVEDFCNFVDALVVSLLTAFSVSTSLGYGCTVPDLSPYDNTLYHDGVGAYPALGDTVYEDAAGLTPAVYEDPDNAQIDDLSYLRTDPFGVRIEINCK